MDTSPKKSILQHHLYEKHFRQLRNTNCWEIKHFLDRNSMGTENLWEQVGEIRNMKHMKSIKVKKI